MSLIPAWAREAAVIGLELQVARDLRDISGLTDEEYKATVTALSERIKNLPK